MKIHTIPDYWLIIFFLAVVLVYRLFRRRIKGAIGEKGIAVRLAQLSSSQYKVINNLVLDISGKTSQIDHLIISHFGLFVVETKNFKGWILGYENSEYWTQVIYKRKEQFYNPIRQNRGHISALRHCLSEFPSIKYIPIVVFSNNATIKVETESHVIYAAELTKVVKRYSDVLLSKEEMKVIYDKISSLNISSKFSRSAHLKSIKRRIKEREGLLVQNKCP